MRYDGSTLYNVTQDADGNEVLEQVYPYLAPQGDVPTTLGPTNIVISPEGVATIAASITTIQEGAYASQTGITAFVFEGDNPKTNGYYCVDEQGILYNADKTLLLKAPNSLTNVDVPDTVTRIARGAFYGCSGLESIVLPASNVAIGDEAFKGCDKLSAIALSSVTDLGVGVFEGVTMGVFKAGQYLWTEVAIKSGLADFVAEGGVPSINSLWYGWNWSAIDWNSAELNSSVTTLDFSDYKSTFIPHYAFAGLTGVKEIVLPANVAEIGNGAFYFCTNLKDVFVYNPTAIQIATSSGGMGDSGSGIAGEEYAVSQPGSFAWWNPDKESDAATGAKYEDYTGLNFYGAAYAANPLVAFCANMGHNFIPVVALDTLSAAENPFATDAQAEYALDYGTGANDYGYVSIADIAVGGTPQVIASFGDFAGTRDLTNDPACAITYYGPDGKATTSFNVAGTYTAELVGDGKSVFGERTVSFEVKAADNPGDTEGGSADKVSIASAVISGVSGKTYTGSALTQSPVVKVGGKTLKAGSDYTVSYANNVNAGTATMTITGKGSYVGAKSVTFKISPASVANAAVSGVAAKTYTGNALTQSPTVKVGNAALKDGADYTVSYKNNVNAGTATMTITGKGNYAGAKSVTFKIAKASQAISAKKSVTKKFASEDGKLAKAKTIKLKKLAKVSAKTTVKYKKANKAGGKLITVNKKTGKITVKKGLKAGTYKVKVKLTAAANGNYKAAKAKKITVKVVVKE